MASLCDHVPTSPRAAADARRLTHESSMREKVFEHLLLADLGMELIARDVPLEVLHAEIDRDGYDVVLDAAGIMRHVQLKVTILGGTRGVITVNNRLSAKPSGCVVWLSFDPAMRRFASIRWFGDRPGAPLPDLGIRIARHTRANSQGVKAHRDGHRIVGANRFEKLEDISDLADRLFGRAPCAAHNRELDNA